MRFFFYGSLMDPDVLASVIGHGVDPITLRPARIMGWRRVRVRNAWYPMLVRSSGAVVEGILAEGLSRADVMRLDAYEGGDYETRSLSVERADDGHERAQIFMTKSGVSASSETWDPVVFGRFWKGRVLTGTRDHPVSAAHL